jgi:hypothetical protein
MEHTIISLLYCTLLSHFDHHIVTQVTLAFGADLKAIDNEPPWLIKVVTHK